MARFFGKIGYGESVETPPGDGVWVDTIKEIEYQGDVIRNVRSLDTSENISGEITISNRISVVADEYAFEHFFNIKYVEWAGALWTVPSVEVQSPRLILTLGSVYNGPTPP